MSRVQAIVPSDASAEPLVLALLGPFGAAAGVSAEDGRLLETVVASLVRFALDNAYSNDDSGELEVTLEADGELVHVTVHDWGLPLTSAGGDFGPLPESLASLAPGAQNVQLLNLGADGKRLTAEVVVRSSGGDPSAAHYYVDARPRLAKPADETEGSIEVRAATPEDAEAISQLLYESYHLSYVHADFYRPRYLMAALDSGELLSAIALHEGRVIGHHAVMPVAGVASAETGAAVVHSAYRGLGIFGRLFEHTLEAATERGLASVFGDAVTIHPYSQRAERSQRYRETALQLGMVPAQTTMRGFAAEGPRRRTATLRSYRLFDERPRQVALPAPYRDLLESVYGNVGLSLELRTESAPLEGEPVTADLDEPRALGFLRVGGWDQEAAGAVKPTVRHLLARHVDVIYADLDLVGVGDVEQATAELNGLGFFAAGLVLHGPDGHDHLRLQLLDCEDVELDEIVCDSPFAEALKQRVLEDRARVGA